MDMTDLWVPPQQLNPLQNILENFEIEDILKDKCPYIPLCENFGEIEILKIKTKIYPNFFRKNK
jgi:hypothetical protein